MKKYVIVATCCMVLLTSGCATTLVRTGLVNDPSGPVKRGPDLPPVYPSTVIDCLFMADVVVEGEAIYFAFLPLALIDLPVSILTDTLFLPIDLLVFCTGKIIE